MNRLNSAVVRFFFPLLLASIGFIPIESNAAGELSGVVRNATGDPLIGAYVYARNPMTSQTYADYTDMSGLFEIMNMTAGEYRVRADYVGYQGAYHDGSTYEEDEPATVTVSDGTTTSGVDIMLPDGASISGKVTVQSSGLPVTNQYIPIDYRNSPNIWWSPYSYTDLMGNYQIGGLPDRDDYIIGVAATGYISDYYPGVIDYDDAEPLAITGGMDLTGIDLELTEGGVLRVAAYLESGLPVVQVGNPQILSNVFNRIAKDGSGGLWFATEEGVMSIIGSATRGIHPYNSDLPGEIVRDLSISPTDTKFYATDKGVGRQTAMGSVEAFTTANSNLPYNDCTAIQAVSDSSVFIASPTGDFTVWNGSTTFTNHTYSDRGEPSASDIQCLAYDSTDGEILIGTESNGMTIYNIGGGAFSRFTTSDGLPQNQVNAIAVTGSGVEWIGTSNGIYVRDPGGPDTTYQMADGLPGDNVQDIHIVSATQVWIATTSGIAHYDDGSFTTYTTSNSGLANNNCRSILDFDGDIYIGSSNGLDILSNGSFQLYSRQNWYVSASLYDPSTDYFASGGSSNSIDFDIQGLPTGNYRVQISASGYPSQYFDGVANQEDATLIPVQQGMETAERYAFIIESYGGIEGTVEDSMGNPTTSGTVSFYQPGANSQVASANVSGGVFQTTNLIEGGYYAVYTQSGLPSVFYPNAYDIADAQIIQVTSGQTTSGIGIVLPAASENGTISGRILDSSGNPYPFVSMSLTGVFGTSQNGYTTADKDGAYTFTNVTPGVHRISGSPFGLPPLYYSSSFDQQDFDPVGVDSGEDVAGIDLQVPTYTAGSLFGIIVDGGGNPVSGAEVGIYGGFNYPAQTTGSDGLFSFQNLPPFPGYSVFGRKTNHIPAEMANLALASGDNIGPVTLTLDEYTPTSLSGQVMDASGNRILDANLYFYDNDTNYQVSVRTDWEGRYMVADFPPGSGSVNCYASGFSSYNSAFNLSPGSNTKDIVLVQDTSRGNLWGTVRDSNGTPQPGINVRASSGQSYFYRTNKFGKFLIGGVNAGTYTIDLPDYADDSTSLENVTIAAGETIGDLDFTIDKSLGFVSGTVTDSNGDPVPGPFVSGNGVNYDYRYEDGYGQYGLCGIETPQTFKVSVSESDYVSQYYNNKPTSEDADSVTVATSGEVPNIDFVLERGESISGRVTDFHGRPLQNGSVAVSKTDGTSSKYPNLDVLGNYSAQGLTPGEYTAQYSSGNYYQEFYNNRRTSSEADTIEVVANTPMTGVDFQVGLGGTVSGVITDASGTPYTSGSVYAYPTSDPQTSLRNSSLNATGEYRIDRLPPGDYFIQAQISGRPRVFYDSAYSTQSAMSVGVTENNDTTGIDITVPSSAEAGTISGRTTDENGDPLTLQVRATGVDGYSGNYYATPDSNGDYTITGVPPGTYVVSLTQSNTPQFYYGGTYNQATANRVEITPGEMATGIDIQTLDRMFGTISGTVRDTMSNPLGGVDIELSGEGVYLSTTSGSDGSYTFSAVFPQGGYQMSATLPGYFPKEVLNISVAPNGTVTQDITLQGFTPGSLIGKVYDQDGYPVSSVSIYVDGIDVNYDLSSTSDSFGDYRFDLLPTGTFQLDLSKSGYQYTTISPVSVAAGNTTVRDVTMEEPAGSGSISGTVFDASGNPTAGVRVQVSSPTYRQVTTRLDGTYGLNGLNPGTYSVMLPNEEGDPTQGNIQVMADQNTPNVNFNLDITYGTISGTIRNRMAQPLPGANVRADAVGHSFYPDSVVSGSSGLYIMTRVNNGGGKDYRVYANRDGFVETFFADSLTSSGATTVTIPDGDSVEDIDIVLGPGAIVSGTVVDGDTSLPISSGSVVFNRGDLSEYISINNGSYRTNILPPGEFRVSTSISGYSTEYYDNVDYQSDATVLTIAEGETIDGIDFTPSRSASISGMVVDESGTAYTSGSVRAYEISRSPSEYTSANLSGGEYTLSNLVAGQYYVFVLISGKPSVFYPSAFSAGDAQTVSVSGGQARTGIDITVPSSIENGSISGTVLSRFGTVDSSIRVRVIGVDGTSYNNTSNLDENGNYLAENLLPGTYIVGLVDGSYPVYYYGGVYSMDSATRVTVAPGQDRTGIDIMATEFPQATLTGIVQTQGGTPIPGAEVRLEMGSITYNTTSGSDGSYVFKNILPGADYEIRAGARGYYDSPLEPIVLIENQTSNYNLTLDPYEMTSVMGHVENASGYPLNNANLNLYGDNLSSSRYLNTDDFGNYLFDNLPPGNYSIGVSSSGYTSQNVGGIGTTPGSSTIRNFVLEYDPNYGVVEGTVTDSEGNPAYGILVRSSNSRSTTTQLDGTYQLTNLSAGTYSISLPNENDSGNPMMENVIVVADETTSGIDFTLTVAYGTISGTVMDTVGTPISDANVDPDPIDHDFYPSNVYSGFDGNFIIGRLRTDGGRDYRFAASKDGYVKTYYEDAIDQNLATVIHLNQGDSFSPAPIQLQTAARISGKVSEEGTGRLINTGGVRAQLPDGSQSFYASLNNTGDYLFDELPGGDYQVYTSISNYVTEYYQESANRDDADILTVASGDIVEGIDLTPARAGGISGTVLDASGNAIASGTVYTYPVGGTTSDQSSRSIGNSGEFAFTNVAPGQHYVYAVVSGKPSVFFGNTFFQDEATPVTVSGGLTATGTNITVPNEFQNGSISGSVTNLFGEPYPNLNMTISGVDGTSNNVNPRTDSEGNYSGTSLLPGLYTVAIRESGRPNYYYGKTYDQDMATRVKVEEGMETPNIDIMAPQRNDGSVRGLVKNLSGQLLNGVQVQLQGNSVYQSDTTGPDGLFLFPFVPGGDYELTATAPGYLSAEADVTVQSGRLNAGTIITMEAFTGGAIAGMVTDVSGNPLEDANVNISHSQYGYLGNAQTTRYGDYYYDNLPPGTYSLSSSSSGYDSENRSNVSIPEGGMANEDFALAARSNVGRVSGTVIGANGRGVYRIQVRSEGPSSRTTYTYPDGTYILSNLSAGTYRIYLQNETGPTIENLNVQVTNGETTGGVDFALDQSYGAVSGTVFEKGAVNPVRKGSVRGDVFETGGYIDEADIGSQGNYIIGRVPIDATGGVRARATADGYASVYWMDSPILETANAVTLDASGDAGGIDFGLDFEASLFGRITDFFGTPIKNSNANATLLEASGGISFSDSVNANGWYEIPQLPGGDYRLRFSASYFTTQYYNGVPDLASAELITLPIGGSEQFDAVLNPNTAIGGIVTDASGNPVTNAFVDLYRVGDLNPSRLYVNGNGQYSFQGIAPGDYRLRAYSPDYAPRWWLGQTSATSATILTLESNEIRGGIDFVFSSRSSNVYDLIADGTIDAFDLIELLGLGTDSASTFFDFSQYWMSTTSKSFRVENE